MENINIDNLKVGNFINYGAYANVFDCSYNGRVYALKKMINPEEILTVSNISKFDCMNKLDLKNSVLPKFIVSDDKPIGYLLEKFSPFDYECNLCSIKEKLECLYQIRDAIEELHSNNIIHTDIHSGNIVVQNEKYYLCDFDSCCYDKYNPCIMDLSIDARFFVEERGLSKDLDIYMFNILSFWSINEIPPNITCLKIFAREYGVFDNKDAIEICDGLLLNDNCPFSNDYLIDTIDIKKIIK